MSNFGVYHMNTAPEIKNSSVNTIKYQFIGHVSNTGPTVAITKYDFITIP